MKEELEHRSERSYEPKILSGGKDNNGTINRLAAIKIHYERFNYLPVNEMFDEISLNTGMSPSGMFYKVKNMGKLEVYFRKLKKTLTNEEIAKKYRIRERIVEIILR